MKIAVLYSSHAGTLSYNDDWLEAFLDINDDAIDVEAFNYIDLNFYKAQKILFEYDYVVFLHSTNSNGFSLPKLFRLGSLNFRRAKVVFFVGNEFKLMPEKINFIKLNRVEFVVSQLPQETAEWLYTETKSKIISLPHALNPNVFRPINSLNSRAIDIGNRSYEYPWYLGDVDRIKTLEFLNQINSDFEIDISTDPDKRFERSEWAEFLNSCKFTIASEAGSSYLERDDKTRHLVNKFMDMNTNVNFDTIYDKFFKDYKGDAISGKCISSRHFDAVGTKTCQILLEGQYNNILKPNEHYIELKKDFSNIDEVIKKIKDDKLREEITDRAYEYVIKNHTHKHRISYLLEEII